MKELTLKQILLGIVLMLGSVCLVTHWLDQRHFDEIDTATEVTNETFKAVESLKDARFHVVQIQQFLTDISATHNEDGYGEASENLAQARARLASVKQLIPTLGAEIDAAGKALELVASGASGGLAALRAHLADDAVSWACVGFAPGYPYGEGATKFASLTCVGGAVGAMKKGKVALQKSGVFGAFEGLSADVGVYQGAAEATDEAVLAELKRGMPNAQLLA
jgi:hypothetical protein